MTNTINNPNSVLAAGAAYAAQCDRNLKTTARSVQSVHAEKFTPVMCGVTYRLMHRTAGHDRFGNMVGEAWGCIGLTRDGSSCGRWCKTEAEARDLFAKWTA